MAIVRILIVTLKTEFDDEIRAAVSGGEGSGGRRRSISSPVVKRPVVRRNRSSILVHRNNLITAHSKSPD
ncbi:hypothetical protein HanPI659440_Chr09g0321721 [Helianthus annuus]|nr:hypothetical protein HanPI659440_Chr09g0321721 [Helianthus annuus]